MHTEKYKHIILTENKALKAYLDILYFLNMKKKMRRINYIVNDCTWKSQERL